MRTLHIDIETSPNIAYVWDITKPQHVSLSQLIEPSRMLCAGFAFEDDDVEFVAEWKRGGKAHMLKRLHAVLSEADAVVHYNGKSFDTPIVFAEFLQAGYGPPAPFQQIDLYGAVKRNFKFASGKLAHVSKVLGHGGKLETNMALWTRVLAGDKEAREEMERYNVQDVKLLQSLYLEFLPWIPQHPNVALIDGLSGLRCTACGSDHVVKDGRTFTSAGVFQRYRCQDCGKWSRDYKRDATTPLRSAVIA